jgi:hypothetical protein
VGATNGQLKDSGKTGKGAFEVPTTSSKQTRASNNDDGKKKSKGGTQTKKSKN